MFWLPLKSLFGEKRDLASGSHFSCEGAGYNFGTFREQKSEHDST
jgi:hypothetical protein